MQVVRDKKKKGKKKEKRKESLDKSEGLCWKGFMLLQYKEHQTSNTPICCKFCLMNLWYEVMMKDMS